MYVIVCQDDVDCSCAVEMRWNMALLRMPRNVTLDLFPLKMTFQLLLWAKIHRASFLASNGVSSWNILYCKLVIIVAKK